MSYPSSILDVRGPAQCDLPGPWTDLQRRPVMRKDTLEARFWAKVDRWDPDWCWEWTAVRNADGYGQFKDGTMRRAHRVAYELLVGPVPEGLTLDHLCNNRGCVNPKHLEPVTLRENILRGSSPSAIHARKTHCVHGHPLDGSNLHHSREGWRICRTCQRTNSHHYNITTRRLGRST